MARDLIAMGIGGWVGAALVIGYFHLQNVHFDLKTVAIACLLPFTVGICTEVVYYIVRMNSFLLGTMLLPEVIVLTTTLMAIATISYVLYKERWGFRFLEVRDELRADADEEEDEDEDHEGDQDQDQEDQDQEDQDQEDQDQDQDQDEDRSDDIDTEENNTSEEYDKQGGDDDNHEDADSENDQEDNNDTTESDSDGEEDVCVVTPPPERDSRDIIGLANLPPLPS